MRASPVLTRATVTDWRKYREASRRPGVGFLLILPLLVIYHSASAAGPGSSYKNGADVWLTRLFASAGIHSPWFLPIFVGVLFVGWHLLKRDPWNASPRLLTLMACESIVYAGLIYLFAYCFFATRSAPAHVNVRGGLEIRILSSCGAGVYEELLFRLILLPTTALCLIRNGIGSRRAWWIACVATALFFASLHYSFLNPYGEPFDASTYAFRFGAGMFFGAIFLTRGFGIAAAAHASYDVLVAVLAT